jgi:hypothetical protein
VDRSHKLTWGMIAGATAFCTGPYAFTVIRFLLGLAEAGFYPGQVLFFTYWFPDRHRARVVGGLRLALPLASCTPVRHCVAGARVRECVPVRLHFSSGSSNVGARADMYSRAGFAAFARRANEPDTCYPPIGPRKAQEQCSPGSYSLDADARVTDKGA